MNLASESWSLVRNAPQFLQPYLLVGASYNIIPTWHSGQIWSKIVRFLPPRGVLNAFPYLCLVLCPLTLVK